MQAFGVQVRRWPGEELPTEAAIRRIYHEEGLAPARWSNGPLDVYGAHTHAFHKVLYCVRGSIAFDVLDNQVTLVLAPGDRLDLPAGVMHSATVGPSGVTCLEAHRE